LQSVKSFQMKATVSGKVNIDLTGQGGAGALDLAGTTANGDVDIANKKAHISFDAPALLGTGADIIVVDQVSYVKISGPFGSGDKYQKQESTSDPTDLASDPQKAIADLKAGLDKLSTPPTKGADERCGDKDCYKVTLKLAASDLGGLASSVPGVSGDGTIDVWVHKDDLRPAKLQIGVNAGDQGAVTITLELTNYDGSVSIQAPPADQIQQ
ncbi:MAG TPA: LppX_LprAFG lipoprotein, partial [Candidatus Limnocylindrales bacterium]